MSFLFQDQKDQIIWSELVKKYEIDEQKQYQFKKYLDLIMQENQKYNLTTIVSVQAIILDHFYDSLALQPFLQEKSISKLADVGSGGGFPGIPLAIMNEALTVHLIEVTQKKIQFLMMVVDTLGLKNVRIHSLDWRTFLRKVTDQIEVFTARASLPLGELVRIFKPSSSFHKSILVYWASKNWEMKEKETEYFDFCKKYKVGDKERSLCFFKRRVTV
ncbi:16S rRNA (guanine(527)-N(7))-methyltransferase RsmG [Candidatus Dependentiae bacterium]|nr:16S rRNA (guanine(527)-N(7))-methyltransferase RsmG [Candidatus Dependentiae bacterium]